MSDCYKYAAKNVLRFPSKRGELTVEHLFQLPLKAQDGFDLDTIARTINTQLKGVSEESFVDDVTTDPRKIALTVSLELVKDVIATKQEEKRRAEAQQKRRFERNKLLNIIATKKDQALSDASIAELEKKLEALDEEADA